MADLPLPRRSAWALPTVLVLLLAACAPAGSGASGDASDAPSEAAPESAAPSVAMSEAPSEEASEAESSTPMAEGTVVVADSPLGDILTDAEGMTLYLFTNDTEGVSNCSGDCLANWPPLTVASADELAPGEGVSGELGTIERDDGTLQVTIEGLPLYYYAADSEPGDISGHQVGGVWFAVAPDGAPAGEEAGQSDYEY